MLGSGHLDTALQYGCFSSTQIGDTGRKYGWHQVVQQGIGGYGI